MSCRRAPCRCLALLLAVLLSACASQHDQVAAVGDEPAYGLTPGDPHEAENRATLKRNLYIYDNAIEPVVRAYRWAVPDFARDGMSNLLDNLATPRIFVNDLLQGEWERAAESFARLAINSTIGFGGLFDRASQMGIPRHEEDFGQTLAVYGVSETPYLVVPLFGPSNPRDSFGRLVDMAFDPVNYLLFPISTVANLAGTTVERFSRDPDGLEDMRHNALDFYATLRGAYLQKRAHEIRNGTMPDGGALEAMDGLLTSDADGS